MKKLVIAIVAAFFLSSCELVSFDEDINKDPNLPTNASAPQLIANAMLSLPDLSSSPTGEYLAQYLSKTEYVPDQLYPVEGTSFYWFYQSPLINLQTVIDNSEDVNEVAVAKILKAYFFWHITDRWGPIPYSEALEGVENFTPAYDKQAAIYDSLFNLLEDAVSQINTSGTLEKDIMYGGNMEKWVKFANTVHMLMALRLSNVDEAKAEEEFTQALNAGIMTSNDDSFIFEHLANANNQNYWYGQIVSPNNREWWALSESLVGLMEPVNDPRLPVYGDTTAAVGPDQYAGLPFGTQLDGATDPYSLLGNAIHAQDAPVYLVTYAQALFARAEAAQRGWTTENTATLYNDAITASIEQWTGSTDDAATFLAQPEIAFDPATALEQIATQRYVHLFMHGYEGWAEWRRTGYPDNLVSPDAIPLRQIYTSDEALNNTENYETAVGWLNNGNTFDSSLWWDAN